jgi:hypothetical protein
MEKYKIREVRLPGVEPGSIAWKAIILTVGLQTPLYSLISFINYFIIPRLNNLEFKILTSISNTILFFDGA